MAVAEEMQGREREVERAARIVSAIPSVHTSITGSE